MAAPLHPRHTVWAHFSSPAKRPREVDGEQDDHHQELIAEIDNITDTALDKLVALRIKYNDLKEENDDLNEHLLSLEEECNNLQWMNKKHLKTIQELTLQVSNDDDRQVGIMEQERQGLHNCLSMMLKCKQEQNQMPDQEAFEKARRICKHMLLINDVKFDVNAVDFWYDIAYILYQAPPELAPGLEEGVKSFVTMAHSPHHTSLQHLLYTKLHQPEQPDSTQWIERFCEFYQDAIANGHITFSSIAPLFLHSRF